MARMVATKAALSIRVDALSDAESRSDPQAAEIGITNRVKLESRLRALEHQAGIQSVRRVTVGQNGRQQPKFEISGSAPQYNSATDNIKLESAASLLPTQPASVQQATVGAVLSVKEEKKADKELEREERKKEKKKRKSEAADISAVSAAADVTMDGDASLVAGESKEERRARKEAKKAVSL